MKEQATKAAGPKAHSAAHGRVITFTLRPRSTAGQSEDLSGPDKLLQYVPWFLDLGMLSCALYQRAHELILF